MSITNGNMASLPSREPDAAARPRRSWISAAWRAGAVAVGVTMLAGLGGFGLFVADVLREPPPPPRVDGIVALTGGAQRINDAMELLANGTGKRVLISGVNPKTTREEIIRANPDHRDWFECCVDLGYQARNTTGNAIETRRWLNARAFTSVLVVTSAYHMPRSLVELGHALPRTRLVPYPVAQEVIPPHWWRDPATLRLLGIEYVKYVVASLRTLVESDPEGSRMAIIAGGRKPVSGSAALGL